MTISTIFSQIESTFHEIFETNFPGGGEGRGGEFTDLLIGFPALLYTSLLQRVIIIKQIQQ